MELKLPDRLFFTCSRLFGALRLPAIHAALVIAGLSALGATDRAAGEPATVAPLPQARPAGETVEKAEDTEPVPVQAEPAPHQTIEMARQEVGEVERAWLRIGKPGELAATGEKLVAMRPGYPLDPFLFQDPVEQAPGTTITVSDKQPIEVRPALGDEPTYRARNPLWSIVQLRWQAAN